MPLYGLWPQGFACSRSSQSEMPFENLGGDQVFFGERATKLKEVAW